MLVHSLQEQIIKVIASDRLRLAAFPLIPIKLQQVLHDRGTRIADLEAMIGSGKENCEILILLCQIRSH